MSVKADEIKQKLDDPISGGRIDLGSGLMIFRVQRTYTIYHGSHVRGGAYPILEFCNNQEFENILAADQRYMEKKKRLEDKGYHNMGKGLYFLKDKQGKVVRDNDGRIIETTLRWEI